MNETKKDLVCSAFVGFLLLIAWFIFTGSTYNGAVIENHNCNIIFYVITVMVFMVLWLLMRKIINNSKFIFLDNPIVARICCLGFSIAIIGILIWNYINENKIFASMGPLFIRQNINPVFFIIFAFAFVIILNFIDIKFDIKVRYLLAIICSFVVAACEYTPNPIYDVGGGIVHYDAYTTSIFNALAGTPFSDINISVYGHYAAIYYPFIRLFGGGFFGLTIIISFLAFCTILFWSLAGIKIIKSDKNFLLYQASLFLVPCMLYINGSYYQVFPHRCFFPAIIVCLCAYLKDKNKIGVQYVGWVMTALALIWNFETGIVCAISYWIYLFLRCSKIDAWNKKNIKMVIKAGIIYGLQFLLCIVAAWGGLNLYNIMRGGKWLGILDFIYPIMSDKFSIDALIAPFPKGIHISAFITLAFLVAICSSARKFFQCQLDEYEPFICMISANGIGAFMYFINRTAYANISISCFQIILLLFILVDTTKYQSSQEGYFVKITEKYLQRILFGIVAMLALEGVFYMGIKLNNKKNSSWKTEDVETWKQQIADAVPKDTPAIGLGVNTLYGFLGWDTGYHITDFPDLTRETSYYVREEILNIDAFFANESSVSANPGMEFFDKRAEFPINGTTYVYYTRKKTPSYALGDKILFCAEGYNADVYVLKGITHGTEQYSWTLDNIFKMWMSIGNVPEKLHGTIELAGVFNSEQNVSVLVNGTEVYNKKIIQGNNIEFDFMSNGEDNFIIELNLPDAVSPASIGMSEDARNLALGITSIVIEEAQ